MDSDLRQRLCERIAAGPPSRFAVVFGSTASGAAIPGGGLHIGWLPADSSIELGRGLELGADLSLVAGIDVDLVRVDQASTVLKMEIARHGDLLCGDRAAWVTFRAEAISEFLDFEPALRSATRRFKASLQARRLEP